MEKSAKEIRKKNILSFERREEEADECIWEILKLRTWIGGNLYQTVLNLVKQGVYYSSID